MKYLWVIEIKVPKGNVGAKAGVWVMTEVYKTKKMAKLELRAILHEKRIVRYVRVYPIRGIKW